jgi:ParB-like chromosome segregation protein Spo0J
MHRTADLVPYARNARTHTDAQIGQIMASIREFGWTNPVLIDAENGLIAGHGRVLAAHKLRIEQVPCLVLSNLTPTQVRAYRIVDNQLALNAGWDAELLLLELADLKLDGFDLALTGFGELELTQFFAPELDPATEWEPPFHSGGTLIK